MARRPLTKRVKPEELGPFRLTKRDIEIIQAVYDHRALTRSQIQALFFPATEFTSRCQYRLQMLYHHGYLSRVEQPSLLSEGRKPFVYFLDEKGADLVARRLELFREDLDWEPQENQVSHLFLDHLLDTNSVRIAISLAAGQKGWSIETWLDDRTLKQQQRKDQEYVIIVGPQGGKHKVAVVPDGYFVLKAEQRRLYAVLEIDRRTVTGQASAWGKKDWARKVRAYVAYWDSGLYEKRYQTTSLRVLTVTTGEKRLGNLKAISEKVAPGKKWFWFTTFDQATPDKILSEAIWQRASEAGLHAYIS